MNLSRWVFFILSISGTAFAADIDIIGTLQYPIKNNQSLHQTLSGPIKQITLLKLRLSDSVQNTMGKRIDELDTSSENFFSAQNLPNTVQLGMNNVPVLDQGNHGSCATFATTAVVDAALNKGDYISQLCLLQLGNYLQSNAYVTSGWDGSMSSTILSELMLFGVVSKAQQKAHGCGGITEYPSTASSSPTTEMSPADYHQISENIKSKVDWTSAINKYTAGANDNVKDIKTVLSEGDRLSFGVILVDLNLGVVGAVGKNHAANDTWLLTPEIKKDLLDYINGNNPNFELGGHAMIITGYDDNAIAIDNKGRSHQGLFTLRNSWGKLAGDQGNYYMSYEYFQILTTAAQRIRVKK